MIYVVGPLSFAVAIRYFGVSDPLAAALFCSHLADGTQRGVGVLVWMMGELVNAYSHRVLAALRSSKDATVYVVPAAAGSSSSSCRNSCHGGLVDYVLFLHFVAEHVAWCGLGLVLHLGSSCTATRSLCFSCNSGGAPPASVVSGQAPAPGRNAG